MHKNTVMSHLKRYDMKSWHCKKCLPPVRAVSSQALIKTDEGQKLAFEYQPLHWRVNLHNIMYMVFCSLLMFEFNLNLSLTLAEVLNARHVARCPITLSSTCYLMLRREEGSASLPPGVIYDWGHVNKNIKTIWALWGKILVHHVHHARQAHAGNRRLDNIMLVRMPCCPAPE